jgi:hypothetical protein
VPPRRDVEEQVYAQLYGEPSEPCGGEPKRVIGDRVRELPAREELEPAPVPPRLSRLDDALSWAAAQVFVFRRAAHSGRAGIARAGASARGGRPLALAGVTAAIFMLVAVAVLSGGSPDAPEPRAAASSAPDRSAERKQTVAREAREARRRRAARRKRAARRRAAERAEDRRAEAAAARERETVKLVCVEGAGCVPPGTVIKRRAPAEDGERSSASADGDDDDDGSGHDDDSSAESEDDGSNAGADVDVETSGGDEPGDFDVDVDVD